MSNEKSKKNRFGTKFAPSNIHEDTIVFFFSLFIEKEKMRMEGEEGWNLHRYWMFQEGTGAFTFLILTRRNQT